jgi:hypothetical protein
MEIPIQRQPIVSTLNRFVVSRLGGLREAAHAERLQRNNIDSIWDDRVLNRAYEVFEGIPEVELFDVGKSVPEEVITELFGMVSKPD